MPEYIPLFTPGQALPYSASATVTGGQLLAVSGSATVAPTSAATGAWLGVAAFDTASGQKVTIHTGGVQLLVAPAGVTAGDRVTAAAAGGVATFSGTDYSQVVGVALTTAAAGARAEVKLAR